MGARITAPVEDYSGPGPGGLVFVDGTAETGDLAVIGYCQGAGYRVEPLDDIPLDGDPDTEQTPDGPQDTKPAGRSRSTPRKGDA